MIEPFRKREQQDSSNCQKKPRPQPPLEDFKYFDVVFPLRSLQERWNLLDADGEYLEFLVQYGHERSDYLRDMHRIVKGSDEHPYENPFGADDRENFNDTFEEELTKAEQQVFYSVAQQCQKENRRMTDKDLNEIILQADACMPTDIFFVSLDPDTNEAYANGTERFPFASTEQAERKIPVDDKMDGELVVLKCSPSCQKVQCCLCITKVCKGHGDTGEASLCMDGPPLWNFSTCIDCGKISCSRHRFRECRECRNGQAAEIALGMHEYPGRFDLCKQCGQRCKKIVDDEELEEKYGTCCNFWCCKKHINNHKCGDNPTEHI